MSIQFHDKNEFITFAATCGILVDANTLNVPLSVYTVAALPSGQATGTIAFASNGLKTGEITGSGTGIPVYYNSVDSSWKNFYTNATAAA